MKRRRSGRFGRFLAVVLMVTACSHIAEVPDVPVVPPPPPPPPPGPPPPPPAQVPRAVALNFSRIYLNAAAGVPVTTELEVRIVDSLGNLSDTASAKVSLSVPSARAQLSGPIVVAASRGIARFPGVSIGGKAGSFRMTAKAAGLDSNTILVTIAPGPEARLVFRSAPTVLVAVDTIRPAIVVDIQDLFGNTIATSTRRVTLALLANADGAVLQGPASVQSYAGSASFENLVIDRIARNLVLEATADSLIPARSAGVRTVPSTFEQPQKVGGSVAFSSLGGGGAGHRCGLTSDGTAWCWGLNDMGQLGDGSTTASTTPIAVSGGLRFSEIRNTWSMTCGLTTDNKTYCWGGLSYWPGQHTPKLVDSTYAFTEIAVGYSRVCGLTSLGRVYCGQFHPENPPNAPWTVDFSAALSDTSGAFVGISLGDWRLCGLTAAGAVYCDGGFSTGDSYKWELPQPESNGMGFASLSGSAYHSCGLTTDGDAYCWGQNDLSIYEPYVTGELGVGHGGSAGIPTAVVGGHRFTALSAGRGHTCGIATDGSAWCWGTNLYGELGTQATPDGVNQSGYPFHLSPSRVAGNLTFRAIYTGPGHTCALAGTEAWCWGSNRSGELWQTPPAHYRTRLMSVLRAAGLRR